MADSPTSRQCLSPKEKASAIKLVSFQTKCEAPIVYRDMNAI